MTRLLYVLLLGLLGAAIVHISILLLLPVLSERDAWSRLAARAEPFRTVALKAGEPDSPVPLADPFMEARACRFDTDEGVVHVTAAQNAAFWSVSIYDRRGYNIYSFNDRTAAGNRLDLAIASPEQMIQLRKDLPEELARSIFVEIDNPVGIAVVRVFRRDPTFEPVVSAFLDSIGCSAI